MSATELLETWRLLHPGARRRSSSLRALQARRLRAAVAHAYEQIPFYREVWDERGFRPSDIDGIDDLHRMPIVTSAVARDAAACGALLSREARAASWPVLYTSGSSGTPTAVACGPAERWLWWAFGMRISLEHGIRTRDAILRFDPHPGLPDPRRRAGVSRATWVSTALPVRQRLARFLETEPAVVVGTPTSLRQLCEAIATSGIRAPRPRVVLAQGEVVDAATRRMVRSILGADPVSLYGLTEVGYVAWQCERREGFHVNAEAYLVEVLRDGRRAAPGEVGALVVTDVCGRARPLLRYDTGDLAIAGDGRCPCGRSLPIIASIEGRASDSMLLPDGRVATARAIVDGLAGALSPGEYRLHQEAPDRFRVMLADLSLRGAVAPRLLSLLGDVELHIEAEGPSPRAGVDKTRVVSSAVPLRLSAPMPGA